MTDEFNIGLTDAEWRKVGAYANSLIQNDMTAGKFQNGKSNLQYINQQYKKYKAAGFKHLKYKQSIANPETGGLIKSKKVAGKRKQKLFGMHGKAIESTNTAFVDMTLTGKLKKSLEIIRNIPNGIECGFTRENAVKIIQGNNRYSRQVVGLSEENVEKVKVFIDNLVFEKLNIHREINIDVKF